MVKGAFIMGLMYTLKDQLVGQLSTLWSATLGQNLFTSLKIANDQDNKLIYDQLCFYLRQNYQQYLPNSKLDLETIEYNWIIDGPPQQTTMNFNPAVGNYWITYNGTWVWMNITSTQLSHGIGWEQKPASLNTIELTAFGWKQDILVAMVQEARKHYELNKNPNKTMLKQAATWYPNGKVLAQMDRVSNLNNIVLPAAVQKRLMRVLDNFKDRPYLWHDHHQTYRESILFAGPPGNGKTRLLAFIAGYLGYDILLINLSSSSLDDDHLLETVGKVNPRTVIALEEIDAAGPARDVVSEIPSKKHRRITMSGLLLALDGPVNKDGPMVVATTNCYEKLDPALIRPGRFNHHIKLDWSNHEQQEKIFKSYYPTATPEDVATFVTNLEKKQISCAALVGYLRGMSSLSQTECESSSIGKSAGSDKAGISPAEVARASVNIKSAEEVDGARINLDSPIEILMEETGISKATQRLFKDRGIGTLRQFKYLDMNQWEATLSEEKTYEISTVDKLIMQNLVTNAEKSKDKILCDLDQPAHLALSSSLSNTAILPALEAEGITLRLFKMMTAEDVKGMLKKIKSKEKKTHSEDKKEQKVEKQEEKAEKQEEKQENGKKDEPAEEEDVLSLREEMLLKIAIEKASKMEDSNVFISLSSPFQQHLSALGASSALITAIEKLGIKTVEQFMGGQEHIKTEFDKPKFKIPLADRVGLSLMGTVVRERVEEKELFQ